MRNSLCFIAQKTLGKSAFYVHQEPPIVPAGGSDCEGDRLVKGLYRLFGDVHGVHPIKELKKQSWMYVSSFLIQRKMIRLSHFMPSFSTIERRNTKYTSESVMLKS